MSPNEHEREKERREKIRNVVGATKPKIDDANKTENAAKPKIDDANKTENAVKPTMNDATRTNVDSAGNGNCNYENTGNG